MRRGRRRVGKFIGRRFWRVASGHAEEEGEATGLPLVKVTTSECVIVCEFKRLFIRQGTIIEMQWSYNLDLESLSLSATCFFFKIPFSGWAIDS